MKVSLIAFASFASAITFYNVNSTDNLLEYSIGAYGWSDPNFATIYETCNETNSRMINAGLKDSLEVSSFAKQRLLDYGAEDPIFKRWFGDGSIFEVIGLIDFLVESQKSELIYRCDDIDGNCAAHPTTYPGYRREDYLDETVICDLFYTSKKPLSTICFDGTLVETGPKHYAGVDLLHRYLHVPRMSSNGYIAEYVETLEEILDYAENNSTFATRNVDTYLYYIADTYADAVIAGGCLGDVNNAPSE